MSDNLDQELGGYRIKIWIRENFVQKMIVNQQLEGYEIWRTEDTKWGGHDGGSIWF